MIRVNIKKRMQIITYGTYLLFALIAGKLFYEQVIHHEDIQNLAQQQWQREFTMRGARGVIYDCQYQKLAYDVTCYALAAVPSQIENPQQVANQLALILKEKPDEILTRLSKKASSVPFKGKARRLQKQQADQIQQLNIKGVYIIPDVVRYYPNEELLSHVLGFSGIDGQGLAGIELTYDHYLRGSNGSLEKVFDARGNLMKEYEDQYIAPKEGMRLKLTIDLNIQRIIDNHLEIAMKKYQCKQAIGVAMNPNNGAVLAMVAKPDYNPNDPLKQKEYHQILPIWMSYEPGSTLKSLTFAAALEEGVIDMFHDYYDDKGYEIVMGRRIKSWKAGGHGHQSFLQVLENSSNPGFVEISRRLGSKKLYKYVKDFGLTSKTGIDLPGESKGIMFDENMNELQAATVAFGQGISITPIQLVSAFSAVVNGGIRYQPYLVEQILDPYSEDIIYQKEPVAIQRVISQKTSEKMRYALESVVANGGGKNAYMQGYPIGGKTGTAQKVVDGSYSKTDYILSFLSAAPIYQPEIVLYIALDSPRNDVLYGGTLVAPIVKSIYEEVLPYLQVEKKEGMELKREWPVSENIKIEQFIGRTKKDVQQEGVQFEFFGEGDKVIDQLPAAGTYLESTSGKVWIYLGN